MSKVLNSPFTSDPFSAPGTHEHTGCGPEDNPPCCSGPGDDVSVVAQVLYHKSEAVKVSPAVLVSPQGTGITGLGKPKGV